MTVVTPKASNEINVLSKGIKSLPKSTYDYTLSQFLGSSHRRLTNALEWVLLQTRPIDVSPRTFVDKRSRERKNSKNFKDSDVKVVFSSPNLIN